MGGPGKKALYKDKCDNQITEEAVQTFVVSILVRLLSAFFLTVESK